MINLNDILKAANGQLFGEQAANLFTDFCLDPQQAGPNKLFVALRTDKGDTHQYIEEAIKNGASGILCVEPPTCDTTDVSVLMVNDTVDALLLWSRYTLSKLNVKTIAVTGSAGKSVAVDAIAHVLSSRYKVLTGNVDVSGKLSIPLSLAKLTNDYSYAVLKLSATIPDEMQAMVEAIQPHIAVVTNIDCVHPAAFANCKQYIDEEAKLLEFLSPDSLAILNYDDDRSRELANRLHEGVIVKTASIDRFGADILAFNVKVGVERVGFDLRYDSERYVARWSPILGKHHLYGLLASVQIADFCKIPVEEALKSLTELVPLAGRMSFLNGKNGSFLVDDSFAASHASTMAALGWLQEVRDEGQRTFFIFGDMDNLGTNSRNGHRSIGQEAAKVADIIITQGVEAALAGRAAIDSGKDASTVRMSYSPQDTIAALESFGISDKDIILVKGGVSAGMERVVRELLANPQDAERLVRQEQVASVSTASLRPSWIDLDTQALANNIRIIKEAIGNGAALMAVVKADAYGHGAVVASRTALANGATYLAVASMAEAVELRDAGIDAPILVLSYSPAETARQAHRLGIALSVYDLEQAELLDRAARSFSAKLRVHVKIDTGMGRLGIFADDAIKAFRHLQALKNLEIEGLYTHFSSADSDIDYTNFQAETFQNIVRAIKAAGIKFSYSHASNSPAILRNQYHQFNMVRAGLVLYGLSPSPEQPLFDGMKPVMAWKTTVLQVRTFPDDYPIGYGNTYFTRGEERIAIIPVGYADGLRRAPQTWEYVLIHGQKAPLVGRVSMEKTAVNVSHIPDVKAGDEVVLLGTQGGETISADMIAEWLGTSNYEVVTSILPRVPRR